jgi:CBS domain-containing protein
MLVEKLLSQAREKLVTIPDAAPLLEAAKRLRTGIDIVVVCDPAGILAGVITKTDVVGRISECHGASCVAPASQVMTRAVVACRPGDWLHKVWDIMKEQKFKNIPVTDAGSRPIGVLTARDVLEVLLGETQDEEALLRDYVMGIGYH